MFKGIAECRSSIFHPHWNFLCLSFFFFSYSLAPVLGFPCGTAGKESACNVGDLGLTPGFGRSPGEGKGYPLQYSALENSVDCRGCKESDLTERLSLSLLAPVLLCFLLKLCGVDSLWFLNLGVVYQVYNWSFNFSLATNKEFVSRFLCKYPSSSHFYSPVLVILTFILILHHVIFKMCPTLWPHRL